MTDVIKAIERLDSYQRIGAGTSITLNNAFLNDLKMVCDAARSQSSQEEPCKVCGGKGRIPVTTISSDPAAGWAHCSSCNASPKADSALVEGQPCFSLAELIETRLLGVEPDEQDLVLEDYDWRTILAALSDRDVVLEEALRALLDDMRLTSPDDDYQLGWTGAIDAVLSQIPAIRALKGGVNGS